MDLPERALRVMRAYGASDWLRVVHTGFDGGFDGHGRRKDLFRRLLHEQGYHFVHAGHTYYVRVPGSCDDLADLVAGLKALAGTLRRPDRTDTRNNRSRVKVRLPTLRL